MQLFSKEDEFVVHFQENIISIWCSALWFWQISEISQQSQ